MSDTQNNIQLPEHGKLTIHMANDYLFRALLPQNNKVITDLIASLLHLFPSEITSVEITNPIVLGESTNDKTFFSGYPGKPEPEYSDQSGNAGHQGT